MVKRKKNRLCKCGNKFKDHPILGCDWKPKINPPPESGGISSEVSSGGER